MLHPLWYLLPWLVFGDPVADEAERLKRTNDFFGAERIYLANEPGPAHIVPWGEDLAAIALRLGNLDAKTTFYRSYLIRGRNWRGTALLTLSALAAHRGNWDALEQNGTLFFQEFDAPEHPATYRLIYYLARYTAMSPDILPSDSAHRQWFQACRDLSSENVFPNPSGLTPLPETFTGAFGVFYRHGYLLDSRTPFTAPPIPETNAEATYAYQLIHLHEALVANIETQAVSRINQIIRLDRELGDPLLRVHFYPLYRRYFADRDQASRVTVVDRNLQRVRDQAVLPLALIPGRIGEIAAARTTIEPTPEEETEPAVVPEPPAPEPETTQPPEDSPTEARPVAERTFEALEQELQRNPRGLELEIKAKRPDTIFKRIYQNFLLGLYYQKTGRSDRALERLDLARRLIEDVPFPNLEIKILLALADYYRGDGNPERAEWYAIQAAQLWNAPETLSLFPNVEVAARSPYLALIDQALAGTSDPRVVHQLLYYSEAEHFYNLRRRAYSRFAVTRNPVLSGQLNQIGQQLSRLVNELAEKPGQANPVTSYNQTLSLWNQLWQQVIPFYQKASFPSIADIQKALSPLDRVLVFVESETRLGALLITQTQALAISLGSLSGFMAMTSSRQFDFLEGRLGPVWNQNGRLLLRLSHSLRQDAFVNTLRDIMDQPDNLQILLSARAFMTPRVVTECRGTAVFSQGRGLEISKMVAGLPATGLTWRTGPQLYADTVRTESENPGNLIFNGSLILEPEGLFFDTGTERYPLHELVHRGTRPCSLALIDPGFGRWIEALDELELISPDGATTLYPLELPSQYNKVSQYRFGLRFSWAGE